MNRELRRAAEKLKKQAPLHAPKAGQQPRKNKPTFVEQMLAYHPIESVLKQLASGEIECTRDGTPIHEDIGDGTAYQVTPAMRGWVSTMERIHAHYNHPVDFTALIRLCNKLDAGMPITQHNLAECIELVATSKAAYKNMDVYEVKSLVNTEMIAFEFERLKTTH